MCFGHRENRSGGISQVFRKLVATRGGSLIQLPVKPSPREMKTFLLCLFFLPLVAFSSARAYTGEDKEAREQVLTAGQGLTFTASNLKEKWPNNEGLVSISNTADSLYRYLRAEASMESFWSSGGPGELKAYADSLNSDNRLLKTILVPLEEAAKRVISGIYEDLRAKLACWVNGENWSRLWKQQLQSHIVSAWPALRVCVAVTIYSKSGSDVSEYQVAANAYTREDDQPPNYPFPPNGPPFSLCLPPGYYKVWLVKGGENLLSRYVALGTAGEMKLLDQPPEEIPFKVE
jgi:hypothetical protein